MHFTDTEILNKLVAEIAFVSKNPDSRAEKTAHEYAASLLHFVRQCTANQVSVHKRVIGFWGINHNPTFGTVKSISNDGVVCIVWDGKINFSGQYDIEDIKPKWVEADSNKPGIYLYQDQAAA
ncbi:hypothetical protein [uncultured Mediterranean phage uvMED]|nr:hypothetical protein [uncultured Mediterranean phage uvMED]